MNVVNMNIKEFIEEICKEEKYDTVDDILDMCGTQSMKGFVFEKLFDIVIKFGFCNRFPNSEVNHLIGNSNCGKLSVLTNYYEYGKEKVISGNASGCSDITVQSKKDGTYFFMTAKYFELSNGDVDTFDVQKVISMAYENNAIYKKIDVILLVNKKEEVIEKVKKANKSSTYITKFMKEENIMDKSDLNRL